MDRLAHSAHAFAARATLRRSVPTLVAVVGLVVAIAVVEAGWRDVDTDPVARVPVPAAITPVVDRLRAAPRTAVADDRTAAVLNGVVFGRTDGVVQADERAFLDSGLWHVLAASGQNVALVAACAMLVARVARRGRWAGTILALVLVPLYVIVVGGGASIVRAAIMGELALIAWVVGRLPDVRHAMVLAAAIICWWAPGSHRLLGFQLSFACVAALAWATPTLTSWFVRLRLPAPVAAGAAVTVTCSLATAPLLLARTGSTPLAGAVANLVAVPLAGALLVVGLAGSILHVVHPLLGAVPLAVAGVGARGLLVVAHVGAALPAAQVTSPVVGYMAPAAIFAMLAVPSRWRRRVAGGAGVVIAIAAATLSMSGQSPPGSGRSDPDSLRSGQARITVLDVGQGDATLVQSDGATMLVDTGPPDGQVVEQVRRTGAGRIDVVVLTHDSLDHRGGLADVVEAFDPPTLVLGSTTPGPWQQLRLPSLPIRLVCAGATFEVGHARAEVLHPPCDGPAPTRTGDQHNDNAIVLRITHGRVTALLSSDAEAPVTLPLQPDPVSMLRVGHHGSDDPELGDLLAQLRPGVAAISVGAGNAYGHPRGSTLAALRGASVPLVRTDRDGSVAFTSDGGSLRLQRLG